MTWLDRLSIPKKIVTICMIVSGAGLLLAGGVFYSYMPGGAGIGGILLISVLFALALSFRLQKFVSGPILSLTRTASEVSASKDYSLRATKYSEDEIGALADSFNEILVQVQTRQAELEGRTRDLVKANRMRDEFLATLSHELRTPLNAVLGWSVLIQGGRLPEDRVKAAVEAIERNARVQVRLIEDLLDVSRIISGKFTLDSSEVALRQIVEGAIDVVRPAAEGKQIRIEFYCDPEPPRVLGDGSRLQQAVWNVMSNAVKFTGRGGSIHVRLEKKDRTVRISVEDDGTGILPEFLPFVFDRFRQADGSSTRAHGGLGLGLAIVRHIVEMHGGAVRVESQGMGKGAKFTLELPPVAARASLRDGLSRRGQVP